MIDGADDRVISWAERAIGTDIVLGPPVEPSAMGGVAEPRAYVYLLDLLHAPSLRGPDAAPRQFVARYLIATTAADSRAAHRLLGELAFAALAAKDLEAEFVPLSAETWAALGARPQPSFFLRVPVRQDRPSAGEIVRHPLVVHLSGAGVISGRVLGVDQTPVRGASVCVPSCSRPVTTDERGRFVLSALPTDRPLVLEISFRGHHTSVDVEPNCSEPIDVLLVHKES